MVEAAQLEAMPVLDKQMEPHAHLHYWFEKIRYVKAEECRTTNVSVERSITEAVPFQGKHVLEYLKSPQSQEFRNISCAARLYLDHPSSRLLTRLSITTRRLISRDVVIAFHLRYGDTVLMDRLGPTRAQIWTKYIDDRGLSEERMRRTHSFVKKLISEIEGMDSKLRVHIFLSSDLPQSVTNMTRQYGGRMLLVRMKRRFSYSQADHLFFDETGKRLQQQGKVAALSEAEGMSAASDYISDWFLLALSDILVRPMQSGFSQSAAALGMHGPCDFNHTWFGEFSRVDKHERGDKHASRLQESRLSEGRTSCAKSVVASMQLTAGR